MSIPMEGLVEFLRESAVDTSSYPHMNRCLRWATEVESARAALSAGQAQPLTDEQIERLIDESGGHWKEDIFCIASVDLSNLLIAAHGIRARALIADGVKEPRAVTPQEDGVLRRAAMRSAKVVSDSVQEGGNG